MRWLINSWLIWETYDCNFLCQVMGSAMGVPFDSYTPFDWACFASGVIVPLPAL
jgi:hypothetical protein